jgi:hypothetical protein
MDIDLAALFVVLGILSVDLAFDLPVILSANPAADSLTRAVAYYVGHASAPYNYLQGVLIPVVSAIFLLTPLIRLVRGRGGAVDKLTLVATLIGLPGFLVYAVPAEKGSAQMCFLCGSTTTLTN